jgi:diguanylate cyclase (GGDEF)-like protein
MDGPAGPSTAYAVRGHYLPVQVSSFVGRQQELAALRLLVAGSRLVTLSGPGGTGKTRLALELAPELLADHEDGVWFVDLSATSRGDQVVLAVTSVLGIREQPGRPLADTLLEALATRSLLIVLDNCEQVIDACAETVDACLRTCPGVRVLATSREPLAIEGERVFRVQPLPPADATSLFADRASAQLPGFEIGSDNADAVAQLCERVDGIPLAVELAAARIGSMSVDDISARLSDSLSLLSSRSRVTPHRQRTLRAAIEWSYDLLDDDEREGFLCLSAFVGDFDMTAADDLWALAGLGKVPAVDLLGSLVAKSLVQTERTATGTRYRVLDSFKHYAAERLSERSIEVPASLLDRHAMVYLQRAGRLSPIEVGTTAWLEGLDADHDNLHAAFRHLVDSHQTSHALELASTLRRYWHWRGSFATTATLLERCLADRPDDVDDATRARALVLLGDIYRMSNVRLATAPLVEALRLARSCADRGLEADVLETLAFVRLREGDEPRASELCEQALSLSRLHDTPLRYARKLSAQATVVASAAGGLDEGVRMCVEAVEVFRRERSLDDAAMALSNLAWLELERDDVAAAVAHLEESADLFRTLGIDVGLQVAVTNLGLASYKKADFVGAHQSLFESLSLARRMGLPDISEPCFLLALCLSASGDAAGSAVMHGIAEAVIERQEIVFWKVYEPLKEADEAKLRLDLGDRSFEELRDRGRATASEEAMEIALKSCRPQVAADDRRRSQRALGASTVVESPPPDVLHDLLEISQRLIELTGAEDMYRAVAREAIGLVPSRSAAVVMQRGDQLQLVHETGWLVPEHLSAGVVGQVAGTGRPASLVAHDEPSLRESPASLVAVPLVARREVVGVVALAREANDPYSAAELLALRSFSAIAAAAIESAEHAAIALRERFVDPLTDVGNRRRFDTDLAALLVRAEGPGVTLVMVDIDNFKAVNDTYGHQVGDSVLRQVASVLRQTTRPGDAVYRYGGEEFCVLMPATTPAAGTEVAERLREGVAACVVDLGDGRSVAVTASFGVAASGRDFGATLAERADAALYRAKAAGRNRVEVDAR